MKASEQAVIQNLKDAGCCRETVERFLALGDAGDVQGQLQLLAQHGNACWRRSTGRSGASSAWTTWCTRWKRNPQKNERVWEVYR